MSRDTHLWGTERIRGELLKLGIVVSNRSIRRYRWRGPARARGQTWRTFLRNHAYHLWAADLLIVPTLTFKTMYVLIFIAHGRECLDHVIILGEPHLLPVLREFAAYYNRERPHRTLGLHTPEPTLRRVTGPIRSHPLLTALHHVYERVA